jgi:hypothetical protein
VQIIILFKRSQLLFLTDNNTFCSFFFLDLNYKTPIIQKWNGDLSAAGDTSNSPARMFGRKYPAPTSDLFATGNGALAFIRHTCDGKLGFNVGNGMYFAMRIPKLPDLVQKFSDIVQNVQTCRSAVNKVAELTLSEFRNRWSLWTLDPILQRLTSPVSKKALKDTLVNPYTFVNDLNDAGVQIKMPSSCTHENWEKNGDCRLKFTGLKLLLGSDEPEDLYAQIRRCPDPQSGSLPAFAIVADGPQLTFSAPFQGCNSDKQCNANLKCVDINNAVSMEEIFKDQDLKFTPSGQSIESKSGVAMAFPLMSDPISTLIFGQANGMKSMCSNKDWYGKGTQRMIRHLIRRMNNGPSDGKTDLKVCVPSIAVNVETDGLNGLKRFLPDAFCSDSSDAVCREANKDKLLKINGEIIEIRGLEETERKACSYQLLEQFSQKANGKWSMKPEIGRKWLTTKIKISRKFQKSACTQPDAVRSAIIKKLKENNYDLFQSLEPRHVLIQCPGYKEKEESATKRRSLKTITKRNQRLLAEDDQEVSISIQLDEKQEAEGMAATKESLGSSDSIANALAEAGVTDESGTPITASDVTEVEVASETSDDIEVEKLPDDIASAMGEDAYEKEEEEEKKRVDWILFGILIGVGGCVCCMCAIGAFLYCCCKKKAGNNNSGAKVAPTVPNVVVVPEQQEMVVVQAQAAPVM